MATRRSVHEPSPARPRTACARHRASRVPAPLTGAASRLSLRNFHMDGSIFPAAKPQLDIAKAFWELYAGEAMAPVRLSLLHPVSCPAELKKQGWRILNPPRAIEGTI